MLEGLSILIFLAISITTVVVALVLSRSHDQAVERIASRSTATAEDLSSPSDAWRQMVGRIGSFVPASPRDLPVLKRRLVRAGFRSPNASRFFSGMRLVAAVILAMVGIIVGLSMTPENLAATIAAGALLGYVGPGHYLAMRIRRRQRAIAKGIPNALDLMVVCVESGLGLDQAILQVSNELHHAHPEICDEFAVINLEMRAGKSRAEALHNLAERTGVEDLRKLVAVLIQTDRFGTSIATSLRGHADYMRVMVHQRAEEQASKLPVKLVFPIFFCILPSLFVVTLGPVMTKLVRDLLPLLQNQ